MHRRQPCGEREGVDANLVSGREGVRYDIEGLCVPLERLDDGRDVLRSPDFPCGGVEAELARLGLSVAQFEHG